jgi:hypothetical protein|tara:strand:+ start:330 stop:707 length:378 start_codon:yes stop_codon:yes gene_type:complete
MFEKTIQSPHGMGELKAIFETFSATYNETVGVSSEYKLTETVGKTETSDTSFNILNYQMYYWVSAASREAYLKDKKSNNKPMIWLNSENNESYFYTDSLAKAYSSLSPELKAEKHFKDVVLAVKK